MARYFTDLPDPGHDSELAKRIWDPEIRLRKAVAKQRQANIWEAWQRRRDSLFRVVMWTVFVFVMGAASL